MGSGKSEKITITNDKGRLSADEIERMVNDAEKFKADDDKQKERIAAKNGLESYCFNMKSTLEDEKLKDKINENDQKTILDKCNEAISWLDGNQTAEVEEFKEKQKELESFAILSSPNCMVANPEECQMEVLEQHQMVHQPSMDLDPLSKKLINY